MVVFFFRIFLFYILKDKNYIFTPFRIIWPSRFSTDTEKSQKVKAVDQKNIANHFALTDITLKNPKKKTVIQNNF